jgi:hypothetical protein
MPDSPAFEKIYNTLHLSTLQAIDWIHPAC